ncbi:MAG: ATP-binding cassette domain-containing protein [Treponema sp.]
MLVIIAIFCDVLAPNNPDKIDMSVRFAERSFAMPLGADAYGRCIFSRLLYGTRYSMGLAADIPAYLLEKYPHELSGSQQKRICIIRVLSIRPKLAVLDEAVAESPYQYDKARAVSLLEHAGWTELNGKGIRMRNGTPLQLRAIYQSAKPIDEQILTAVNIPIAYAREMAVYNSEKVKDIAFADNPYSLDMTRVIVFSHR